MPSTILIHSLWNVLDLAALHLFLRKLYGPPLRWRPLYGLLLAFFACGTPWIGTVGNGFYTIVPLPFYSLCLLPFFKTGRMRQILFSASLLMTAITLSLLAVEVPLLLKPYLLIPMWVGNLCMHVGLWLLLLLIARCVGPDTGGVPKALWAALLAIPLLSLCVLLMNLETLVMLQNFRNAVQRSSEGQIALSSFVLLFINLLIFYIYDRVARLRKSVEENGLLERQIAEQTRHYESVRRTQNTIRSLHHDMKNQLSMLSYLFRENKPAEAGALLASLEASVQDVRPVVVTGNEPLDAMLDMKLAELREAKVQTKLEIAVPRGLGMTFAQAATIFGNLLDNVREACLLLPEGEREMSLKMAFVNEMLYFTLTNSCIADGLETDAFVTRKPDKLLHGIGLQNVSRYVRKMGGMMEYGRAGSRFTVKIVLYHMGPPQPLPGADDEAEGGEKSNE